MTFTDYLGSLLQTLSVASVASAVALAVLALLGRADPLPPQPRRDIRWVALNCAAVALGSRVILALAAWGLRTYGGQDMNTGFAAIWAQWDGNHYLDIARYGYTANWGVNGGEQHWFIVFYPLYPLLVAAVRLLVRDYAAAGVVVSWACLVGACVLIYRLAEMDHGPDEGLRAVRYLLIFPAAFFLGATYTESLFLLLTAGSLYAMRRRHWALAGILGFGAALARNLGVLLAIPYVIEVLDELGTLGQWSQLRTADFWRGFARRIFWVVLIPMGLGVYLWINYRVYGDAFAFLQIQKAHWSQQMQPFWQTVLTTWKCALNYRSSADRAFLWIPQLCGIVALLAALPIIIRRLRPSMAWFLIAYFIVALSASWLLSFYRYAMGAVPLILGLAALTRKRWVDILLTGVFFILMFYLFIGFVFGQMVV